jgi:hypothetical protein
LRSKGYATGGAPAFFKAGQSANANQPISTIGTIHPINGMMLARKMSESAPE